VVWQWIVTRPGQLLVYLCGSLDPRMTKRHGLESDEQGLASAFENAAQRYSGLVGHALCRCVPCHAEHQK
jgi:hypothetical protein